jgi:membrane-associated progesterone receptor component
VNPRFLLGLIMFSFRLAGTIFDVSAKRDVYGPGKSYSIFAGKDGSKGLGMSSLNPEHAIPDYTGLSEADMKVLNDWHDFFSCVFLPSNLRALI